MLVLCRNCLEQFRPGKLPAGQVITHQKCQAIFKVVYVGSKICCPHCRVLLVLSLTEQDEVYLGQPVMETAESGAHRPASPRLSPDDEPTEVDIQQPGRRSFVSTITRTAGSKKARRYIGSFVGSMGLFFFYLVLSNGLHQEIPAVDSKAQSATDFSSAQTPSPPMAAAIDSGIMAQSNDTALQEIAIPASPLRQSVRTKTLDNTIEILSLPPRQKISSSFGFRKHPLSRHWRFHNGIDIAQPAGTAVHAALSGRVIFEGYDAEIGNYIKIQHADGYMTIYGHNARNLVHDGQLVEQGQPIALVGMTGMATGPHIHFELRRDGVRVNPLEHKKLKLEKLYREVL